MKLTAEITFDDETERWTIDVNGTELVILINEAVAEEVDRVVTELGLNVGAPAVTDGGLIEEAYPQDPTWGGVQTVYALQTSLAQRRALANDITANNQKARPRTARFDYNGRRRVVTSLGAIRPYNFTGFDWTAEADDGQIGCIRTFTFGKIEGLMRLTG